MSRHLSFLVYGKAPGGQARVRTTLGKSDRVGDRRQACGNVGYGGTRNPPHIPKGRVSETLHLRLCAPHFYPGPLKFEN